MRIFHRRPQRSTARTLYAYLLFDRDGVQTICDFINQAHGPVSLNQTFSQDR